MHNEVSALMSKMTRITGKGSVSILGIRKRVVKEVKLTGSLMQICIGKKALTTSHDDIRKNRNNYSCMHFVWQLHECFYFHFNGFKSTTLYSLWVTPLCFWQLLNTWRWYSRPARNSSGGTHIGFKESDWLLWTCSNIKWLSRCHYFL